MEGFGGLQYHLNVLGKQNMLAKNELPRSLKMTARIDCRDRAPTCQALLFLISPCIEQCSSLVKPCATEALKYATIIYGFLEDLKIADLSGMNDLTFSSI